MDPLTDFEETLLNYINTKLNGENKNITIQIMDDVIYNYLIHKPELPFKNYKYNVDLFDKLYKLINVKSIVQSLLHDIDTILNGFNLPLKAHSYGSTSNIYRVGNKIHKVYRDDNEKIFKNEVAILKKVYTIETTEKTIIMDYLGESLYHQWDLPLDWKDQIADIFIIFDTLDIFYPEFNLKNILVKNGIIYFIDFGLASLSGKTNYTNYSNFIEQLENKLI